MDKIDLTAYRELFPSTESLVWLSHAGVSPTSRPVAEAVEAHARDVLTHGAAHVADWVSHARALKPLAARLINCMPSDLSITPNTTHGINLIAHGLRWRPGDQVVLASQEYPANVYPWWAQQSRGVELVWVDPEADGRIPVSSYAAKITDRTRVVTVSHVQFASGYRNDLAGLGEICRQAGALLVVDAIQSFSVFPIDVDGWGIDALSTGSHKWLCGPTGVALFYANPRTRDALEPTWVGADAVVDASDYLDYRFELKPDGRRFENAMLNFGGIAGLHAALEVVEAFGREHIEAEIRGATDRLVAILNDLGFKLHGSRTEDEWSGIVSATHPEVDAELINERLKRRGIIATVRDGRLRLSPHAYHPPEHFDRIGEAMAACVETTE